MKEQRLEGVRVAVLAADGFEQVELTKPVNALRRAGADVRVLSLRPGRIQGMNFLARGGPIVVDDLVSRARAEDYGALLLPGGFVNPDLLRQSERAKEFVRAMDQLGRPIATICHGPEVLVSAGLVAGRRLASWPGIADDIRNAGGEWVDDKDVRDRNWVSSRSPLDLGAFIPAMIELFRDQAPVANTRLRRPVRWGATLSRVLTLGAVPLAVAGTRALLRSTGKTTTKIKFRRAKIEIGRNAVLIAAAGVLVGLAAVRRLRRPGMASVLSGLRTADNKRWRKKERLPNAEQREAAQSVST